MCIYICIYKYIRLYLNSCNKLKINFDMYIGLRSGAVGLGTALQAHKVIGIFH
jgi:hypothetical protein